MREAICDVCEAHGIAAALEFSKSDLFPSQQELQVAEDESVLLLDKFKDWITASSEADVAFQHRATAFLVYGPILQLHMDMAMHVKLCTRHSCQSMPNLDSGITTQTFSAMLSIYLLNGLWQQGD